VMVMVMVMVMVLVMVIQEEQNYFTDHIRSILLSKAR
jgi:hypothetical protein